ncbi:MAG: 1,4-alpha-glucan branching protein GlgB [Bacteroidota bacterium]
MIETKHTTRFTDFDIQLFKSGKHFRLYEKMGSHLMEVDGEQGTYFAVWAPNADEVSVIGNFNYWNREEHPLFPRWDQSGIWEGFIPGLRQGTIYKYSIKNHSGRIVEKGDPYALAWEVPPKTASVVWSIDDYKWKDKKWMNARRKNADKPKPYSVYEVHMGSWKKKWDEGNNSYSYLELANEMVTYVKDMGFTHVEFMPVMEHPFYGSWGYQITGYFAPSSRFGTPQEFMALMDAFHQAGIGVILDWVPSHFPNDAHGLADFDGTHLYDHEDPRLGFHPDWKSCIFNYGRHEVRSFLISNALFWLDKFHVDGLRVDAVASMLYLDYSREEGQWIPNQYGGNENLEAIAFLKEFNETVYREYPDAVTIAEESTSWSGVSRPTFDGGLGFGQKWMMGWMHDALEYFKRDSVYRRYHQNEITFSLVYAFTENFMLPLSHDEVVHGKNSLLYRMPGDDWQRFANLRLLYGYMFMHPGTKLLFMGSEFGQTEEWSHDRGLDWWLLDHEPHRHVQSWMKSLNHFYSKSKALYELAFKPEGFEWVDYGDHENSIIVFLRKGSGRTKPLLVVCNFTPGVKDNYQVGVPHGGKWTEVLNSDLSEYGGSGVCNKDVLQAAKIPYHGREHSLYLRVAPLSVMVFQ